MSNLKAAAAIISGNPWPKKILSPSTIAEGAPARKSRAGDGYRLTQDADGRVLDFQYSQGAEESYALAWKGTRYVAHGSAFPQLLLGQAALGQVGEIWMLAVTGSGHRERRFRATAIGWRREGSATGSGP